MADAAVDGGGGDGDAVGLAALQVVDGAGGGGGVAGGPVAVCANGQGRVEVRARHLQPLDRQLVSTAVQLCGDILRETGGWRRGRGETGKEREVKTG